MLFPIHVPFQIFIIVHSAGTVTFLWRHPSKTLDSECSLAMVGNPVYHRLKVRRNSQYWIHLVSITLLLTFVTVAPMAWSHDASSYSVLGGFQLRSTDSRQYSLLECSTLIMNSLFRPRRPFTTTIIQYYITLTITSLGSLLYVTNE